MKSGLNGLTKIHIILHYTFNFNYPCARELCNVLMEIFYTVHILSKPRMHNTNNLLELCNNYQYPQTLMNLSNVHIRIPVAVFELEH